MTHENAGPFRDTYWVRPDQLLAGPYPHERIALRPTNRLAQLKTAGVTFFLNLTETHELAPYDTDLTDSIEHHRFPIVDMDVPSPAQMCSILDTLDAALAAGHTAYVHCWGGIGRTGTVIGCWLVRHGMTGPAALDEIVRLRGGMTDSPQTPAQFDMVRGWRDAICLGDTD